MTRTAAAFLGGQWASGLVEVADDLAALDTRGRWAVAIPYTGRPVCARFARWSTEAQAGTVHPWQGPGQQAWRSSLDAPGYARGVEELREAIAAGTVYQANLCRVLQAPVPDSADIAGLWALLAGGNPSPHGGFLRLPDHGVSIASASPELFLGVQARADGRWVSSGPIKGTGTTAADLSAKDEAENIMIVDLVRNDIARVTEPGSVHVPRLLEVQQHPGLAHLVSYVEGRLLPSTTWPTLIEATFPPGSVTGAPKSTALRLIDALETVPREYYCGAVGWVDADTGEAELAVAIRTFWVRDGMVRFGAGAGITWGSDPEAEWAETELKAHRLLNIASGSWQGGVP